MTIFKTLHLEDDLTGVNKERTLDIKKTLCLHKLEQIKTTYSRQ